MANMFSNESRQFKFDILVQIGRAVFNGDVDRSKINAYARDLVQLNGPRFRCCVYKEREVLRQRVRLAMGEMANDIVDYNPRQIVQVIDAACDGCTIKKILVTDNCRKCMAKPCLSACRFGAIHIGTTRSEIDYEKCKSCGACANACPYKAIVVTERPCFAHCPVQAISWDENNIAVIDEDKCINCGQCLHACPFGAIEDISWVKPVAQLLTMGVPAYAIVAPSIQGQFDNTALPQIMKAIEMLGFEKCFEAAVSADAVAETEYAELKHHMEAGVPLTTSCCPGFVNMMKMHFPTIYEQNKSSTLSPMMALARKLKHDHPDHGVVFIGPCLAKKQEAMEDHTPVDYVLTFEELAALLIAKGINPEEIEAADETYATTFGRNFAHSSGVAVAVAQVAKEKGDAPFVAVAANGAFECKKQLMLMKAGKFSGNILEGMCCDGGCINGPCSISDPMTIRARMTKENLTNKKITIDDSVTKNDFKGFDIEIHK